MPFECRNGIVAIHAFPVIDQPDQPLAAGFYLDVNLASSGIDRVFEQLFDYRGGALDDLARRNLVGQRFWPYLDSRHYCPLERYENSIISPVYASIAGPAWPCAFRRTRRLPRLISAYPEPTSVSVGPAEP